MAEKFPSYREGIHNSRILQFDKEPVIPVQPRRVLEQINLKSTTEVYNFLQADPRHCEALRRIMGVSEDEIERMKESMTQTLEKHGIIDVRCGPDSDPCATLPQHLLIGNNRDC